MGSRQFAGGLAEILERVALDGQRGALQEYMHRIVTKYGCFQKNLDVSA